MVFNQINAGGAGPITCSVSADATGKIFTVEMLPVEMTAAKKREVEWIG